MRIEAQGAGIEAIAETAIYAADQAILAAAWGAGDVVRGLGVAIPTVAEPLHMNITEPARVVIQHLIQHAERSITLKQFGSGQIVIGGGWPARGRGPDTPPEVMAPSLLGNVALAARLVPAIGGLRGHPHVGGDEHDDGRRLGHRAASRARPASSWRCRGTRATRLARWWRRSRRPSRATATPPFDPARFSPGPLRGLALQRLRNVATVSCSFGRIRSTISPGVIRTVGTPTLIAPTRPPAELRSGTAIDISPVSSS